jgi:ferredoxin-thioredoxin reductase catalytic chain
MLSIVMKDLEPMFARNLDMFVFVCGVSLLSLLNAGNAFAPMRIQQRRISRPDLFMSKDDGMTDEEREIALMKATKAMTAFTNKYLENTSTYLCSDPSVPAVVIKGLAEHKVSLGAPLCPCRFYDDKEAEAKDGYWNCPCVPMRERHECHCMLFLTEDNAFVGPSQV